MLEQMNVGHLIKSLSQIGRRGGHHSYNISLFTEKILSLVE